jgi:hypothetical protein
LAKVFERLGVVPGAPDKSPVGLSRITLNAQSLVIDFDRAESLNAWRPADLAGSQPQEWNALTHLRGRLAEGERITQNGDRLTLIVPVRAKFRGGQKTLVDASSEASRPKCVDPALVKAVARAHQFRQLLEGGEFSSIDALAKHFNMDTGHVSLTLNLVSLSPAMTRAILQGEQPPGLSLIRLLKSDIPLLWRGQDAAIRHAVCSPVP